MFASNCSSFYSAFSDMRHDADWYSNNLIPVDNSIRKVFVEDSNRLFNPLDVQNIFGQTPVTDLLGSQCNVTSSVSAVHQNECWQNDTSVQSLEYSPSSYISSMGHNSEVYYQRGTQEDLDRNRGRTEQFSEPSSCMNSQVTSPVNMSCLVPMVTSVSIASSVPASAATTTCMATNNSSKQNVQSSGGSVEIKVEVDPNWYVSNETSANGEVSNLHGKQKAGVFKDKNTVCGSSGGQKEISVGDSTLCSETLSARENAEKPQSDKETENSCLEDQEIVENEDEEEEEEEEDDIVERSSEDEASCSDSSVENTKDHRRTNADDPSLGEVKEDDIESRLSQVYSFECEKCVEKSFPNYELFSDHCRSKHEADAQVKCCGLVLLSKDDLIKHLAQHSPSYRSYSCKECLKVLPNKSAWLVHTKQHGLAGQFQCPLCSKRFSSKYGLSNHQNLHLPEDERPYKCRHCKKGFGAKHAMTKHERTHLPDEERLSYVCDICGKRFGYASTLDGHQRHVHQNERPFVCHVCAKTFPIKGALTYHLTTHEVQDRVQCAECGIWLKNEKILRIHKKCHQGELYSCPHCDKVSSTRNNLRMHMKRHNDARPHACPLCARAFKTPRDLKTHMVQHTGQKPYSCPYCPKTFASPSNFYAHRKMKHKMASSSLQY
ncbi:zinc finger protein 260 [Anabrus simplex]|uniref:zinc finger protein 260 n=1 Tax=Anabrus simplex TaxID=316456 RepID=UPI0035A2E2F6